MTRAHAVLVGAVIAHVLGWVLPVARDYRGWQAFRVAFSPLWPFEQFRLEPGLLWTLSVMSALTNALFVVLVVLLVLGRHVRLVLWMAAAATLLDLHWPISMGAQRAALESGYFVWVCSFVLLTLAAFLQGAPARRYSLDG